MNQAAKRFRSLIFVWRFASALALAYACFVRPVYLDYNATTPLDPQVHEAMLPFMGEIFGNPSSIHQLGRRARSLLDDARDRVANVWKAKPSEVVFTSGGTESNNLAIFGTARLLRDQGRHLITSSIEHHAVLHAFRYLEKYEGFQVTYLPVNRDGVVELASVSAALRPDTILVSIMAANNETGSLQPAAEIGALCRARGIIFHTDAVQWFGKMPFASIHQFNADLVSVCSHKFHGPKGAGALFIKSPLLPHPIMVGGGQENERRAGTENLPAIIGFTRALELFVVDPVFASPQLSPLAARLTALADSLPGVAVQGSRSARLPNTVAVSIEGTDSIVLLAGLDLEGVCASSGSACSAGSLEPSHVLSAMGVGTALASSLVRFSLGRENTAEEISLVEQVLPRIIARIRATNNSGVLR